ncbi:hypothetical protein HF285_16055 [Acidithiobacillus ferrooxidans F221]|uniref:hypothetical protein n=1 Tax=Acidithiobacillus ferrooxidans TaxID=920 RepID=UPI001C0712C4|nr:hypothetical protein [Acidithiobacillus ferrooxidans]MBU2809726.1 hypothetical protein [Acidithiobacillus ferrooxidans F221]
MDEAEKTHGWRWLVVLLLVLIVAVVLFFWWQNQQTGAPVQTGATQTVGPAISTQSVANFPVGGAVSQEGTLEGPLSGRCGNIAWHDLSPSEVAHLRKLCPPAAPKQP